MSVRLLTLYVDLSAGELVLSPSQPTPRQLGAFFQGDVIPVRVYLLENNTTGGLANPYSYVQDSDLSVQIGLVTPDPSSPTEHAKATLTFTAASPGYFDGELTLGSGITSLLGSAVSTSCSLEIELEDAVTGAIRTVLQKTVTVKAQGLAAGSPPADPAPDFYPTANQVAASYVKKIGAAGESFVLTSPDGTKQIQVYCDDDGVLRTDTL